MTLEQKIKATEELTGLRFINEELLNETFNTYIFAKEIDGVPHQLNIGFAHSLEKTWVNITYDCDIKWLKPLAEIWGDK